MEANDFDATHNQPNRLDQQVDSMNPRISDHPSDASTDRLPGTSVLGAPFEMETVKEVWNKSKPCFRFSYIACDVYGTVINLHEYGQRSENGWVIDHIKPVVLGGTDDPDNLQPLHWLNNLSKGDHYPDPRLKKRARKKDQGAG